MTEQNQAENALKESEEQTRRMFRDSATGMVLGKMDGRIIEANPAFCEMLGYSEAELRELSVIDLTHPDDRPGMLKRKQAHKEGKAEFFPLDKRYLHKDGRAICVRGTGRPTGRPTVWQRVSVSTNPPITSGHSSWPSP